VLGIGFLALALALLALPATLVVRALRKEPPPAVVEPEPEATALERALLRVERARDGAEPERREALEGLALELENEGSELGHGARRLAWSPAPPTPDALGSLVDAIRRTGGDPDA
jgi:hypothetical protein